MTNLRKVSVAFASIAAILIVVFTAAVVDKLDDVVLCAAFTAVVSICTAVVTALYGEHKATMIASSQQQAMANQSRALVDQIAAETGVGK